jgi:hypothetical protein
MLGRPAVGFGAILPGQQAIQPSVQLSGRGAQSVRADPVLLVAVACVQDGAIVTGLPHIEDREMLVEDAPETYYLTDYYRSYPLVLVRLSRVDQDALHD